MKNLIYGFALLLMLCGAYSLPAPAFATEPPGDEVHRDALSSCSVLDVDYSTPLGYSFSPGLASDGIWLSKQSNSYLFAILNYNRKVKRAEEVAERVMELGSMDVLTRSQKASIRQTFNS